MEKEIKKDNIPILDTGDNPDAPVPREMIDLEVINISTAHVIIIIIMIALVTTRLCLHKNIVWLFLTDAWLF